MNFFRILLTVIISFNLSVTTPVFLTKNYSFINSAIAQDQDGEPETTDGKEKEVGFKDKSAPSTSEINKSENKALQKNMLLMAMIGALAPILVYRCPKSWSIRVFGLGAASYLVMEISNWSKYDKASNKSLEIYKNVDYDEQYESLMEAHKQTNDAKAAAEGKSKNLKTLFMATQLAAVLAIMEAASWPESLVPDCESTGETVYNSTNKTEFYVNYDREFEIQKLFLDLASMIIPKAQAGFADSKLEKIGIIGGLGGAVAIGLTEYKLTEKTLVNNSDWGRAAVFQGLALFTKMVQKDVDKAVDKLNERAQAYLNLANKLTAAKTVQELNNSGTVASVTQASLVDSDFSTIDVKPEMLCIKGGTGQVVKDSECKCLKTRRGCKTSDGVNAQNIKSLGLPSGLTTSLSNLGNMSSDLFSNSQSAGASIDRFNASTQGIARKIDSLQKSINDKRVKSGKKAINFDKNAEVMLKKLKSTVSKNINKLPASALSNLSSIANGNDKKLSFVAPIKKDKNGKFVKVQKALLKKSNSKPSFDFNFDDDSNDEDGLSSLGESELANSEDALKGVNLNKNDINKNDVSIFKVLSVRYMKSAFPKFFDEK